MGRHAAPVPPDLGGQLSTGALHIALHAWAGAPAEESVVPVDTGALQQAVRAWSGAAAGPDATRPVPDPPAPRTGPTRTAGTGAARRLPTAQLPTGAVPIQTAELQQAVTSWSAPTPRVAVGPVTAPPADHDEDVLTGQVTDQPFAPRGARGTPAAAPSPVRAPSLAAPTLDTGPTRIVAAGAAAAQPDERGRLARLLGLRRR